MFIEFVALVAVMLGGASIGFEAGQGNPDANSIIDSKSQVSVERAYGVDEN